VSAFLLIQASLDAWEASKINPASSKNENGLLVAALGPLIGPRSALGHRGQKDVA
jgi:hypothetical protein